MSHTRIKDLQSASSVAEEKFDEFEFVVDSPDPDATLKLSGSTLKKCVGTLPHTHPVNEINGLVGELDNKLDKGGGNIKGDLKVEGNVYIKNLSIEEYLEVPELKYNRITATGSELWVTDSAVVDSAIEWDDGVFMVTLKLKEEETTLNFTYKDILRGIYYTDDANGNPTGFKTAYFEVTGIVDNYRFDCIALNGIAPQKFMTLARQGNKTDATRQGSVYLDGLNKYIRVSDGVKNENIDINNIRAQIGNLSGIDHPLFGQLEGYGALLENAYICGRLIQRDPETGKDWAIGSVAVHGEQVISYDKNNIPSTERIFITATENGFTSLPEERKWQYKKGSDWITIDGYKTLELPLDHNALWWEDRRTITIRYVVKETYEDVITIAKVNDGASGDLLFIRGSGFNRQDKWPIVQLNGERLNVNYNRGHDLVVLRRTDLALIFDANYDTYATLEAADALAEQMMLFDDNFFLIVFSSDSVRWTENLIDAFVNCGSEGNIKTGGRIPYAFLGYNGLPKGHALEMQTSSESTAPHAEICTNIINGQFVGSGSKGERGDKGENGINGTNGIDGTSQFFHVRYSPNSNGNPMFETPATFIGTVVTSSPIAPSNPSQYKWIRLEGAQGEKGEQGIAGKNGENGQTSYLHIKYSDDGGKSFTSNNGEDVGEWIGQYVDFIAADSNKVSDYKWSKIKGESGDLLYLKGTGSNRHSLSQVTLNGMSLLPRVSRGHNYVVLKRSDLSIEFHGIFDTYGSDENRNALAGKMLQYDDNYLQIIVSSDAIQWNLNLVNAFIKCGSNGEFRHADTDYRRPFAFLGCNGLPQGHALEIQTTASNDSPYAEISTNIINGQFVGSGSKGEKGEIGDSITGKMIYRDPEFRIGSNSILHYNTSGNGNIQLSRIVSPSDCPTTSTHALEIKHNGPASPNLGGVYQLINSRSNAIFIQKIIAKIPEGLYLNVHSNAMGSGYKDRFITPIYGTGKYETYIRRIDCGTTGTFSTGGYISLSNLNASPDYPFSWYIASMTVYDMTDTEKYDDAIEKARVWPKAITYCGDFSSATKYYNNQYRTDCVKYGSDYYMYKGSDNTSSVWTSSNWQNFGSQFTSVATGLLLAELAYIKNLGVENLRTNSTGTRIEITKATNGMAFYIEGRDTPVVEIKTVSDAAFLGQGSGILVKQKSSNISINNGILQRGYEGSGVSVPVLPWPSPEIISQNAILQTYYDNDTNKYKTGLYVSLTGGQGTSISSDKIIGVYIQSGGMFIAGANPALRSNNVLCGVTCAGMVSSSGTLLRSWVLSFMGGYLTAQRTGTGRYRIGFSNTHYLMGMVAYHVILLPDGPHASGKHGAYASTMERTTSYFDVWTADDDTPNDCAFTFIVILLSKFW